MANVKEYYRKSVKRNGGDAKSREVDINPGLEVTTEMTTEVTTKLTNWQCTNNGEGQVEMMHGHWQWHENCG